jgi:hypothetical protein
VTLARDGIEKLETAMPPTLGENRNKVRHMGSIIGPGAVRSGSVAILIDFDFAQLREIIDDVPPGRQADLGAPLNVLHGRTIFMLVGDAGVRRPLPYGSYSFGEAATSSPCSGFSARAASVRSIPER